MAKIGAVLGGIVLAIATWWICMYLLRLGWELTHIDAFGTVAFWLSHFSVLGWLFVIALAVGWSMLLLKVLPKHAT
jgi:hypothetical protein